MTVRVSVRVYGERRTRRALAALPGQGRRAAAGSVREWADATENAMRGLAPVDTGRLRRAVQSHISTGSAEVGVFHVRYVGFVEYGTYKDAAQPFILPASETTRGRVPAITRRQLAREIGG